MITKDRDCCISIQQKIDVEKDIVELEKIWHEDNWLKTRESLFRRHEKLISLEQKSGVHKEYKPITALGG
jgi:hypothetical protein